MPVHNAGIVRAAAELNLSPYLQSLKQMETGTAAAARAASRQFEQTGSAVRGMASQLSAVSNSLLLVGGAGLTASGAMVKLGGDLEQTANAYEVMLGSASRAQALLTDVQQFAAATPFRLPEIQRATRSLLAFGISSEQIIPTLRMIGDIAAGTQQPIGELSEIYGNAAVQGRLFMEDINQLTGRGVPVIQALATVMGVTANEVRGLVESGKIGFPELQRAFQVMTAEGSQFGGMTEKLAQTTLGRWTTVMDGMGATLIGMSAALLPMANQISAMLTRLTEAVNGMSAAQKAALGQTVVWGSALLLGVGAAIKAGEGLAVVAGLFPAVAEAAGAAGAISAVAAGRLAGVIATIKTGVSMTLLSPIGLAIGATIAAIVGLIGILMSTGPELKFFREAAGGGLQVLKAVAISLLPSLKSLMSSLSGVFQVVGLLAGSLLATLLPIVAKVVQALAFVLIPVLQGVAFLIRLIVGLVTALGASMADMLGGHFSNLGRHWRAFASDVKAGWREMLSESQKGLDTLVLGPNVSTVTPRADKPASTPAPAAAATVVVPARIELVDIANLPAMEALLLRLQARASAISGQLINLDPESDEAKKLSAELSTVNTRMGAIKSRVDELREGVTRAAEASGAMARALAQAGAQIAGQSLQVGLARLRQSLALGDSERAAAALVTRRQELQLANVRAIAVAESTRDQALLAAARAVDLTDGQRGDKLRAINAAHELAVVQLSRQHDQATALIEADEIRLQHAQRLRDLARESNRAIIESGLSLVRTLGDLTRGGRKTALAKELLAGTNGISAFERQRREAAIATDTAVNAYQTAREKSRQALEIAHLEEISALKRNPATTPEGLQAAELAHAEGMLRYDEATKNALADQEAARERSLALIERQERAARAHVDAEQAVADLATKRARNAAGLATSLGRMASDLWAEMMGGSAKAIADAQNGLVDLQARNLQAVQDAVTAARRQINEAQASGALTLAPEQLAQLDKVLGRPFRGAEDLAALEGILQSGPEGLKPFITRILEAFEDARHQIQLEEIKVKLQIDKASFDAAKRSTMEIFNSALFNPAIAKGVAMGLERMIMPALPALNYALPAGMGPFPMPVPASAPVQRSEMTIRLDKGLIGEIKRSVSDDIALVIQQEMR